MQKEIINCDIRTLETLLRNANYRYKIAIRDGAVTSIIKEVLERIDAIERELSKKMTVQQVRHITSKSI